MNALVGYTGFVGLNLQQFYKFDYFYNSKNFSDAKNKEFDTVFFCGIPAVKWYANKYPEKDYNTIENIKNIINNIKAKKFILISTIDVYENVDNGNDEDYKINYEKNHTYGKNRFLFEEYIKKKFDNYNIIRLPGLFGKGLKKNIIFDLINNNNVNNIKVNSSFQWYYLNWLKKDIDLILKNNIKECNLFTEPIDTIEVIKIFRNIYNIDYNLGLENGDNKIIKYNLFTKNYNIFNNKKNYICDKKEVVKAINEYLLFEKLDKSKLCVSNICVNNISQIQFGCLLKLYGIKNIQVAPTKLINTWKDLNNMDLSLYQKLGLNIYSFQSITYTLNELNIFNLKTKNIFYNHLINVIDYAEKNNVKVIVFGCPRNRKILDLNENNEKIFVDFFKKIGNYLENKNVKICIENNSKKYDCNFINSIDECASIVRKINKNNIKMMVDLGNALMEQDEWNNLKKNMDIIYNIDISNPYMEAFSKTHNSNKTFNYILKQNKYDKIINLEMLIRSKNELIILNNSILNFINIYSNEC